MPSFPCSAKVTFIQINFSRKRGRGGGCQPNNMTQSVMIIHLRYRYPRPYGRGTLSIQAALVRCPASLGHECLAE